MTEERYRKWELAVKIAAPIITVVGLLVGIGQFSKEQENIRTRELELLARNDALEFKRRVWERQIDVYTQTAQVVGEIAVSSDRPEQLAEAVDRFEKLYWGNMILIEDEHAREPMIRFNLEIQDYLGGISSKDRLKVRAAALVDALRASSHASWTRLSAEPPSQ